MRNGTSLALIAVGAILAFAVHAHIQVVSFFAVGVILMLVGAIGPLLTRASFSRSGITFAVPTAGSDADQYSAGVVPEAAGTDALAVSEVAPSASAASDKRSGDAHPLPEARTSDSEWSSPRTGLRAV